MKASKIARIVNRFRVAVKTAKGLKREKPTLKFLKVIAAQLGIDVSKLKFDDVCELLFDLKLTPEETKNLIVRANIIIESNCDCFIDHDQMGSTFDKIQKDLGNMGSSDKLMKSIETQNKANVKSFAGVSDQIKQLIADNKANQKIIDSLVKKLK